MGDGPWPVGEASLDGNFEDDGGFVLQPLQLDATGVASQWMQDATAVGSHRRDEAFLAGNGDDNGKLRGQRRGDAAAGTL